MATEREKATEKKRNRLIRTLLCIYFKKISVVLCSSIYILFCISGASQYLVVPLSHKFNARNQLKIEIKKLFGWNDVKQSLVPELQKP